MKKKLLILLLAGVMASAVSCGKNEEKETSSTDSTQGASAADSSEEKAKDMALFKEEHKIDDAAITGKGYVSTFLTENLPDKKVQNEDEAEEVIMSVIDKLGGDDKILLSFDSIRATGDGLVYYNFNQVSSDVRVFGTNVKLLADKEGKVVCINSSIVPGLSAKKQGDWMVEEEGAEKAVLDYFGSDVKVIKEATETVLIPKEQGSTIFFYAWVVYTQGSMGDYDANYMAHYVSMAGNYLYSVAAQEPGDAAALAGASKTFIFTQGTESERQMEISHVNGSKESVTVPVLNMKDGAVCLGDPKRKIICADYTAFWDRNELDLITEENGSFENMNVLTYYNFIRVYDYFEKLGWKGADGDSTPILVLMNADDELQQNGAYISKRRGYQVFAFGRKSLFGDCVDLMAHEYTHCVTETFMTSKIYLNDAGAINEAISDIIGNLVEIELGGPKEGQWLIGENLGEPLRNMADPGKKEQPAYVGDRYYAPSVTYGTLINDYGGVHRNSSFLNLISYRLNQAGMPVSDQLDYWVNVAMTITPRNDYPDIAKILPWCLKQTGYEKYLSALNEAIEETHISSHTVADKVPEGCGRVYLDYDFRDYDENYDIVLCTIQAAGGVKTSEIGFVGEVDTWPSAEDGRISLTLQENEYIIFIKFTPRNTTSGFEEKLFLYNGDGWEARKEVELGIFLMKDDKQGDYAVKLNAGANMELKAEELKKLMTGE